MREYKDLKGMIQVLAAVISIRGKEEDFLRYSAAGASDEVTRTLLLEIADDSSRYYAELERRMRRLQNIYHELRRTDYRGNEDRWDGSSGEFVSTVTLDPICDMRVNPAKSRYFSIYKRKKYCFCSIDCKKAFELDPEKHTCESMRNAGDQAPETKAIGNQEKEQGDLIPIKSV